MDKIREKVARLCTELSPSANCGSHTDDTKANSLKNYGLRGRNITVMCRKGKCKTPFPGHFLTVTEMWLYYGRLGLKVRIVLCFQNVDLIRN